MRQPNHGPAELVEEAERVSRVGRLGDGASRGGLPFADEVLGHVYALHGRERHGVLRRNGIRNGFPLIRQHERVRQAERGEDWSGVE